ncbi:crotonase/enoyl-CoA hydratase family protein [Celeribacter sp. PS-C1]|uniref:crotonase/enoyl-CoA hydratase family protein n=1 Tax=Celeribacter sp. PS-C1 TaxID=2820813 RepID=UPI001CA4F628|nr:crotonase/enoyl-CoA hydratase family protein [Celeribacter sp. PS-C1]MBW6419605.1 crotonase/enoyl-CoA hydratase family protein [Celeribacter sp. PS-C1]
MTYETIRIEIDTRQVATVTLARSEKHNAMDAVMIAELTAAAERLSKDDGVRVVVLEAEGKTFCAGGDLGWMRDQAEKDRQGKMDEAMTLARMLGLWNALPKPVIGRVHGAAYGGGLGLICVCDIVIAEDTSRFALTETRLGLIPATIGPFVVARLGEAFARQVFFNAKPFDVDFLIRAGVVARSCPSEELDAAIENEVAALLHCAPGAVAEAKALCRALAGVDPEDAAEFSASALANRWETEETRDGIAAFFAKQEPPWRHG